MSAAITPELLRHYSRAIGGLPYAEVMIAGAHDCGGTIANAVAWTMGGDHVFRLGLCAAAEMLLNIADEPDALCCLRRMKDAHDLLGAAGIDPARWEATR